MHSHLGIVPLLALFFLGSCTMDFSQFESTSGGTTPVDGGADSSAGAGGTGSGGFTIDAGGTGGGGTAGTSVDGGKGGEGGTGGTAGNENCLDGIDNDGDGQVDCEDQDCAPGHECVEAIPTGWQGFFRLRSSPYSEPEPASVACPDGNQPKRAYAVPAGPLQCSCSCGTLTGASCAPGSLACAPNATDCAGAMDWTSMVPPGSCYEPMVGASLSCQLRALGTVVNRGNCTPVLEAPNTDLWGHVRDACIWLSQGGGCPDPGVCIPRGSGQYTSEECIGKTGVVDCPSGWNSRYVVYESGTDQRACSPCFCTADPSSIACPGTEYTVYSQNGCSAGSSMAVDSATCTDVSSLAIGQRLSVALTGSPTPTGGQCTPSAVTPTGAVATFGPSTYCCNE